jgi:hypothetical protein
MMISAWSRCGSRGRWTFSAFPTVLLVVTLLRLALNIATTRLILSNGHEGLMAASYIIGGFSKLVMSGDFRHQSHRFCDTYDCELRGDYKGCYAHRRGSLSEAGRAILFQRMGPDCRKGVCRRCQPDTRAALSTRPARFHGPNPAWLFLIREGLVTADFTSISVETRDDISRAPSAHDVAIAYCQGTPLRNEIEARGPSRIEEATVLTVAVLAGNTLLRPLVNAINRAPIDERQSEAIYEIHVVTGPENVGAVRDLLAEVLEKASYPIRQIEVVERSPEATEIVATLVSTAVDPVELDGVAGVLEQSPLVSFASWSSSSNE